MISILKLIRPKHWIKNLFVLAPLIFSLTFTEKARLIASLEAFISFCFMASAIYIINDILDKEADLAHPEKRNRPIASGRVSIPQAISITIALVIMSLVIAYSLNIPTLIIILLYLVTNIAYSIKFKKYVIVDVFFIAFGFILRIYAGAFAIDVTVTHWIILTTFFLSLFLGFGKRLNELKTLNNQNQHRFVLNFYTPELLHYFSIISITLTIMTYALYTIDTNVIHKLGTDKLIYTVPIVTYGLFRYLYILFQKKEGGDVVETVIRDKWIILTCIIWALSILFLLYFKI